VYALQVERIQSERHTMAVLIAAGGSGELPSVQDFDMAIGMTEAPESDLTPEQRELRQELGLRG
jgi:hypothetical protein